jgi:DNA-binding response OmpR family regulator
VIEAENSLRRGPLVLVADDDEDILELIAFRLERAGYEIVRARNGRQALQLALDLKPALAVLDVMMPGLDGYDVTRELRRNEETRTMPVILLTARAQASDVSRGMAAGADDYLKKPFDAQDLKDRVERLLRPRLVAPAGD